MCLFDLPRLDDVPEHSVRLERQLSRGADDDARRSVAVRPLHFVEALISKSIMIDLVPFRFRFRFRFRTWERKKDKRAEQKR